MKFKGNPVVFRVSKGTGQVVALFPADSSSPGSCVAFQSVIKAETIQTTSNYRRVIAGSRPATVSESQAMLSELRKLGFAVSIRQKWRAPRSKP